MKAVHWIAECRDCGKRWEARNAVAVAVRHSKAHGHTTTAEVGLVGRWENGRAVL